MVKAKLLVVDAESNESVHSMLAEQGYQVHLARTPEDTVLSILEGEPEVVIWSEGLDHLTEWQRVKTVLESRKPFLSLSTKWSTNTKRTSPERDVQLSLDETTPVTSAEGLILRLQSLALAESPLYFE